VINTSWYVFPLCTANRRPTKLGRIVAPRFCVLIGGVPGGGGSFRGRGRLSRKTLSVSLYNRSNQTLLQLSLRS
jgi:hypothetical protein